LVLVFVWARYRCLHHVQEKDLRSQTAPGSSWHLTCKRRIPRDLKQSGKAALIDWVAVGFLGVSDWCITPAYLFLTHQKVRRDRTSSSGHLTSVWAMVDQEGKRRSAPEFSEKGCRDA